MARPGSRCRRRACGECNPGMVEQKRTDGFYESFGAVHLHSSFSDGSKPIPEIAEIADEKGLDFLLFSDHNTLEPKHMGLEGIYGRVAVIIGCELNDPDDRNHYLAFNVDREIPTGLRAAEYVRRVKEQGGFGVIAHPAEKRSFSEKYPPYPWTDWEVDGFDGIEIWNQLSEWMEGISRINFLYRLLHPLRSIHKPVQETLDRWDAYNLERRVVGFGGIDVHGYMKKFLGFINLEIYPYKVQFKSIRTHLLMNAPLETPVAAGDFKQAESLIFDAIKNGRLFIVNYSVGDGTGFEFYGRRNGSVIPMGSRIKQGGAVQLCVTSPLYGKIRLMHNGRVIMQKRGRDLSFEAGHPGVYRVEIFRKSRGWIYSNPVTIVP